MLKSLILPTAALIAIAPTALAETLVVRNPAVLQSTIDAAGPGDVIKLRPGTYVANVVIRGKSDLTFRGTARVKLRPANGLRPALLVQLSSGVDIAKLKIEGSTGGAVRIEDSQDIVLTRSRIIGNSPRAAAVTVTTSNAVRITRNLFKGAASAAVKMGSEMSGPVDESVVARNRFVRTFGPSIEVRGEQNVIARNRSDFGGTAISVAGTPGGEPNVIRQNRANRPVGHGVEVTSGSALITRNSSRLTIRDSMVVAGFDHAIVANKVKASCRHGLVLAASNSLVVDNQVKRSTLDGIVIEGDDNLLQSNALLGSGDTGVMIAGDSNVLAGNEFSDNDEPIVDAGEGTVGGDVQ